MRPAPAANTASLVASSASRGTNQTSLCTVESLTFPATAGLRGVVDLGLLKLPRVVDVQRLPLGEDVERSLPCFTMAVARVLRAAERQMHLGTRRAGVDVGDARLEVAHGAECLVDVAREDRGRQAVLDPIGHTDRLVELGDLDERGRRAKDLLLCDPHLRIDVTEDSRPVEEALGQVAVGCDLAAGEKASAFVLADLRVRVNLLDRSAIDDRPDVAVVLPPWAEAQALGCGDEPRLKRVVDLLVHDHTRSCGAALARGAERGPDDSFDCEIEVRVLEHDDRVLAAQL